MLDNSIIGSDQAVVLVTGTFNIVHAEHVQLLEFAARWGRVVVGVNADPYVREKYGELAVPLVSRAYVLRNISFVDEVIVFSEPEPSKLIRKLRPNFFVRGPDYRGVELPEQPALDEVGAKLLIRPGGREFSSGKLVGAMPKSAFSNLDIMAF